MPVYIIPAQADGQYCSLSRLFFKHEKHDAACLRFELQPDGLAVADGGYEPSRGVYGHKVGGLANH